MAQVAMIAGLGVICVSSRVGAALMMGGGEEDGGAGGAGGADDDTPPEYIVYNEDMAYPESGHVELGEATSIEACRDLAKSKFYNTFGFRSGESNTCFAYRWSPD